MGEEMAAAGLLRYMGRTCMDLDVPVLGGGEGEASALRVQWRIAFDWTGEARSEIGVLVGVPGKCKPHLSVDTCRRVALLLTYRAGHQHDERGRLAGLPKLFDELIQAGEDPLDAVRTVVCLLAGEEKS
jgi:hypothetical protein